MGLTCPFETREQTDRHTDMLGLIAILLTHTWVQKVTENGGSNIVFRFSTIVCLFNLFRPAAAVELDARGRGHTVGLTLIHNRGEFFSGLGYNKNSNQLFISATLRSDSAVQCHLTA